MIELSLCVITYNNENSIATCLEPVKDIVDEIVVIDTGSSDATEEIANKFTNRIIDFKEEAANKASVLNFSFSKASKDYIMWLDSEDVMDEIECKKLASLKELIDPSVDFVTILHNYIADANGNEFISLRRIHIVKKTADFCWQNGLVEYLYVNGKVMDTDIVITNKVPYLRKIPGVFENLLEMGKKLSANDMYFYACKLYESGLYKKSGEYFEQFLDSCEGWIGDKLSACDKLTDIYNKFGYRQKEKQYLLKAFEYDIPRAEFCCKLGNYFLEAKDLDKATSWYKTASKLEKPTDNYGFFNNACWTWLPHTQLCVCYHKLEKYQQAYEHNEIAKTFLSNNETIINNKKLLDELLNMQKPTFQTPAINISKSLKRPLRIVQAAPDVYPVPPKDYGGTEVVIYELTEELVKRGYDVYLYAQAGSRTSAKLIPYESTNGWNSIEIMRYVTETLVDNVDIFHYHTHPSIISSKCISIPSLCTIHGPTDAVTRNPVYVSKRALELFGGGKGHFVYNGLDFNRYEFSDKKEDYLLFLGRIDKEKGVHYALEVAEKTHQKLVIAGPIHDYEYYKTKIQSRIDKNPNINYVGSVGGKKKQYLLKHAKCMLFPITWEEPFGLVMIEAMACGTPVVAFSLGSVPEVLGGFPELICKDIGDMIEKVQYKLLPNPNVIRQYVLDNFSASIMTDHYIEIYKKLMN